MDTTDWVLAVAIVLVAGLAFYFMLPPYGALVGVALGVIMVYTAKKRRDKHTKS